MARQRFGGWLTAALLIIGAVCIAYLSTRYGYVADLTAGDRVSIPAPSQALLKQLDGPVKITCYASPGSGLRPTIAAFIARYQRFKPNIALHFVDPEKDPAAMRKAGINVDGELLVAYGKHSQRIDQLSDTVFGNTLARLARGRDRIVAVVTGDGERRAHGKANADLGTFVTQLEATGIRAVDLDFSQSTGVPQDTDLVMLASPLLTLPTGSVQALVRYVAGGGNLLWLTEPDKRDLGLAPLAKALGIRALPGTLVDGAGSAVNRGDPTFVVEANYPDSDLTRGFSLMTIYPHVVALAQTSGAAWQLQSILRSSPKSWNETGHIPQPGEASAPIKLDPTQGELRGPLDFGFAVSRLSPSPTKQQQRVAIIGDGDFLSNGFLGNGGNRAFGDRIVEWLLGDDAMMNMAPRGAPDRHLQLSQTQLNVIGIGFLIVLPLLLLLVGAGIVWRRRRR